MSTVVEICPSMSEFNSLKNRVAALETKTIKATSNSTSYTFNANTVVNAYSLSLESGLWIIRGWLTIYPSSAAQVQLSITNSATGWSNADRTEFTNSGSGIYQAVSFYNLGSTTTIYLNMRCSQSGTRSYGGMSALKVK